MTEVQQVILLYLVVILASQIGFIYLFIRLQQHHQELRDGIYGNQDLLMELLDRKTMAQVHRKNVDAVARADSKSRRVMILEEAFPETDSLRIGIKGKGADEAPA